MNAYFVIVSLLYKNTIHASGIVAMAESAEDAGTVMSLMVDPEYTLITTTITALQDDVLIAMANIAKEKGLM